MRAGAAGTTLCAAAGAIAVALVAAHLSAQSVTESGRAADDLLSELALRIATAVAPETFISLEPPIDDAIRRELTDRLAARGVRVADAANGRPRLRVLCDANLRERTCSAEIVGASRSVVVVARPRGTGVPRAQDGVLELRPMVSLPEPILDLARDRDRLLVLTPSAVIRYDEDGGTWRRDASRPLPAPRTWPRDVRGRFRASGDRFEAFLPGITCAGDADRLAMTCSENEDAWPVPIAGARLESSRNFFRLPDGTSAYAMAPLAADADARWLLVRTDSALVLVDDGGRRTATAASGDDVVAVRASCAPSHVVVSSRSADRGADQLSLFAVVRRSLLPVGSPLRLPGRMTALWPVVDGSGATVVTYDQDAGRYDAHHLSVACPR